VALADDLFLVGVFVDDFGENGNQGSAYFYDRSEFFEIFLPALLKFELKFGSRVGLQLQSLRSMGKPIFGITLNNIPFARVGGGSKTMMVWTGGPGNNIPRGWGFSQFTKGLTPLLDEFSLVMLSRRSGMPNGYTTRDMSDDYAEVISAEYDGHIDLIIGISYGGIIAQHFAADHPELCDHIVICAAAYEVSEDGKQLDYRFAELLSQNKPRQAYQLFAPVFSSNRLVQAIMRPVLWLFGPAMMGDGDNDVFRRDVLIEAEAELAHDGRESLVRISTPTLVLAGDHDNYFPVELFRETVKLIPGGKLIIYPGKGHNIISDKQIAEDIEAWVSGDLE
jgi:pimeloyl-ACP methyl ester carboxylesterase